MAVCSALVWPAGGGTTNAWTDIAVGSMKGA
jgi:hypothetical protein